MNVLAIDYGGMKVGLATGSLEMKLAFPKEVVLNRGKKKLLNLLIARCKDWGIELIVIGHPVNSSGYEDNPVLRHVLEFVELWRANSDVEISLLDEAYSTFEAGLKNDEVMSGSKADISFGEDAYAAQVILQRYFDNLDQ